MAAWWPFSQCFPECYLVSSSDAASSCGVRDSLTRRDHGLCRDCKGLQAKPCRLSGLTTFWAPSTTCAFVATQPLFWCESSRSLSICSSSVRLSLDTALRSLDFPLASADHFPAQRSNLRRPLLSLTILRRTRQAIMARRLPGPLAVSRATPQTCNGVRQSRTCSACPQVT
jgi:hypothetical protein